MHSIHSPSAALGTGNVQLRRHSLATLGWIAFTWSAFMTPSLLMADEPRTIPAANQSVKPLAKVRSQFVHSPRATARCGPSDEYYATATLERGTPVEVYMESSDGWSGIRPPEGSHDWIPAESVYLLPGGRVAEVSADRVAAWIGSDMLKNETLLYQTELIKTQTVSILGEAYRGQEADRKLWFKIAPPPGEFRWVRTSQLGSEPIAKPQLTAASTSSTKTIVSSETNLTGSGVNRASYQPPAQGVAPSTSEPSTDPIAATPNDEQVVWSDEAEQLAKIDREIQREQQQLKRGARTAGPERSSEPKGAPGSAESTKVRARSAATKPRTAASPNASPVETSRPQRGSFDRIPRGSANPPSPTERPVTAYESDDRYWRAMQRQSAQTGGESNGNGGAMDNVLGLFGVSVLEPETPSQQPSRMQPIPRGNTNASARQRNHNSVASLLNPYDPAGVGSNRVDRLPKPRSRLSPAQRPSSLAERAYGSSNVLGTLLTSREPLWGGNPDESSPTPAPYDEAETNERPRGPLIYSASYENQRGGPIPPESTLGSMLAERTASNTLDEPDRFQSPQIQEVLIQLSSIVSRPTHEWKLGPIRDTAVFWIERGETPLVRGEARLLLERVEHFESIRLRTMAFSGPAPVAAIALTANGQALPQAPSSGTPFAVSPSEFSLSNASSTNYTPTAPYTDAVPQRTTESNSELSGWLVAVHTSVPGQPEFALTDNAGNVIAYVRSTTGLNLRRYLQQPVTIFGTPGYIPNLAAKQIVADKVVRIR
jgi:hypothetical protein